MCPHKRYNIEDCKKKFQLKYLEDFCRDLEIFPDIEKGCTEDCKNKMGEIVKITLEKYSKIVANYFKDAKLGRNPTLSTYLLYILLPDDEDEEEIEENFNVKIVDEKMTHPEDPDRDKEEN